MRETRVDSHFCSIITEWISAHIRRMRSEIHGLSHGLKKCPPDTFLPSLRSGRPFKSRLRKQKENGYPFGYPFLFGARGGT